MMAELWGDVERDLDAARLHFGMAVDLFPDIRSAQPGRARYAATMAFLHAMQSGYTSFESGVKRLLALLDEPLPKGASWHGDLVRRLGTPMPGARPALLEGPALKRAVTNLLGFRHVAMHVDDEFDVERGALAIRDAEVFLSEILPAFARFRAEIDPD